MSRTEEVGTLLDKIEKGGDSARAPGCHGLHAPAATSLFSLTATFKQSTIWHCSNVSYTALCEWNNSRSVIHALDRRKKNDLICVQEFRRPVSAGKDSFVSRSSAQTYSILQETLGVCQA